MKKSGSDADAGGWVCGYKVQKEKTGLLFTPYPNLPPLLMVKQESAPELLGIFIWYGLWEKTCYIFLLHWQKVGVHDHWCLFQNYNSICFK